MNALNENELLEVNGGAFEPLTTIIKLYEDLLTKIEQNPGSYTWTMDWYYQRGQTK
jgi:hypothetical protein